MRALVLRDFGDLAVEERPRPRPAAGEVLLRVTATGICGSDLHGFTGDNGRRHPGQVMGHETVGRVAELGAGVSGLRVGQPATVNPLLACGDCPQCRQGRPQACGSRRVIGVDPAISAAFAEYFVAPADNVVPLPPEMPEEYGALIEPLAVGYHAAARGGCGPGQSVLVLGGGPIGQSAVLACRALGAAGVVVSEPDAARRALCERIGAATVDPTAAGMAERVADLFGGLAALAIDAVGASGSVEDALTCTAPGSTVVLVGMNAPRLEVAAYALSTAERSLVGSFCYTPEEFRRAAAWVGSAPPEAATLIERRVTLADAPAAFTALARGDLVAGKVLVFCNDDPADGG